LSPFDIFKQQPDGNTYWVEAAQDIQAAKERVRVLNEHFPGQYVIVDNATDAKLFIPARQEDGSPSPMNAATDRHKTMTCPHCKKEQCLHLLAVPDKPALLIPRQTVHCVACERSFYLLHDAKIVGGPFAV
jgi:hypothetical protein